MPNWDFISIAVPTGCISYDKIVVHKVITESWLCGEIIHNRAVVRQVINEPPIIVNRQKKKQQTE